MLFQRFGAPDHVVNIDAAKRDGERAFGFRQRRADDIINQGGAGQGQLFDLFRHYRRSKNVIRSDAVTLASERVSAVRSTDSFQDSIADKRLQHWLEVSWWQAVACGQRLGRHRARIGIDGNIDDRSNGEDALARHYWHFGNTQKTKGAVIGYERLPV